MELFNTLPQLVQEEIKSTLSAYSECTVSKKANGEYKVATCTVLHNGAYDQFIGKIHKDDIFTQEEQMVNYVNSFRDYPTGYKGKRDYSTMLNGGWSVASMVDGEIIFN